MQCSVMCCSRCSEITTSNTFDVHLGPIQYIIWQYREMCYSVCWQVNTWDGGDTCFYHTLEFKPSIYWRNSPQSLCDTWRFLRRLSKPEVCACIIYNCLFLKLWRLLFNKPSMSNWGRSTDFNIWFEVTHILLWKRFWLRHIRESFQL